MLARKSTRSYSRKLTGRRFLESYANDRMLHRRARLHFYASYGYASISFIARATRASMF